MEAKNTVKTEQKMEIPQVAKSDDRLHVLGKSCLLIGCPNIVCMVKNLLKSMVLERLDLNTAI